MKRVEKLNETETMEEDQVSGVWSGAQSSQALSYGSSSPGPISYDGTQRFRDS